MALGNLIKTWENIMRDDDGVNGTVQVLSQLVWMLFLKVYDMKEDLWELYEDDFTSAIPENCRWRNWAKGKTQKDKITGDELVEFVDGTLFPTLKGLTVTAQSSKRLSIVRDMMAESYNYMKDGVCIRKAVDLLDDIRFDNQEELHSFNVIYETLLKGLQSAGRSGEFYTPRALTELITEKVNPQLGKVTADFACGTGGFLIDAVEHLRKQATRAEDAEIIEKTVFGVEKKQFPYMLCTTNMLLHNVDYPRITHGNSLMKNVRDYKDSEKVDFVLMNPPYGGHEQDIVQVNFPSLLRSSETANLFMIEIMYRLNDSGRAGVILPDGFLQNDDNSLIEIKKKLFKEFNVHTIIRMPGSCFAPYTSIATNMLFFDKTGPTEQTWFYRYDLEGGQKFSMKRNPISREKLSPIDEWWDNRQEIKDEKSDESLTDTWKSRCVSIDDIKAGNYNIDFCGFPVEEKIIYSPEEVMTSYMKQFRFLEMQLKTAMQGMETAINGGDYNGIGAGSVVLQLAGLSADFPEKMKDAILLSAMQGKLTEQLENDGNARELLVKIEDEKKKLIEDGKIKREKKLPDIRNEDIPYSLPDNWEWVRLGSVLREMIIPMRDKPPFSGDIPWCRIEDRDGIFLNGTKSNQYVSQETIDRMNLKVYPVGTVLSASSGGSIGTVVINTVELCTNQTFNGLVCSSGLYNWYLFWFLKSMFSQLKRLGTGTTLAYISKEKYKKMLFPLPPLPEQKRIVDRLNILLPQCGMTAEN